MAENNKFWVDGGILVTTPYFRYENAGAGYGKCAIPDAETLATNRKSKEEGKFLLIDDSNPQSIFGEYYARTFFTTGYCWASMFSKSFEDCREEFQHKLKDVDTLVLLSDTVDTMAVKNLLLRHSILSIMSALDTFIADIVLTRITHDKDLFYKYALSFFPKSDTALEISPKTEQKVIDGVLRRSFMSKQTIKETFQVLFNKELDIDSDLKDLISSRHLLVHRRGRKKDGSYVVFTRTDVSNAVTIVKGFVDRVMEVIIQ